MVAAEKVKILFLANCNSIHTFRWVEAVSTEKFDITLVTLESSCDRYQYSGLAMVVFLGEGGRGELNTIRKLLRIVVNIPRLLKTVRNIKPRIIHAHYATSYGFISAILSHFYSSISIVSLWGSDILLFPKTSMVHKYFVKYILARAQLVLSTSRYMASEAHSYTKKDIEVTPFGVDVDMFKNRQAKTAGNANTEIVIGTVKLLDHVYGIDNLIRAFSLVVGRFPGVKMKLIIAGSGNEYKKLCNLAERLEVAEQIEFVGFVDHGNVPDLLSSFDIFVALSRSESFGIAVIEASATELPVVVSDVGGLSEVVDHGETGWVVPSENPERAAEAISRLVSDEALRRKMGENGRRRVIRDYNWSSNVNIMIEVYNRALQIK